MNLRYLFLPALLFVLISGCAHFSMDPSGSPDLNLQEEADSSPDSDASSTKILHDGQLIERADLNAADLSASKKPALNSAVDHDEKAVSNPGTGSGDLGLDPVSMQKIQTNLDEALELCEVSQVYWQEGELENAVEALDRAYALILNVNTSNRPKLIQQKEDLRFMISKRILEIYASRNIVINGNHNAIPIFSPKGMKGGFLSNPTNDPGATGIKLSAP